MSLSAALSQLERRRDLRDWGLIALMALALMAATVMLFALVPRYGPVTPQLLTNPDFADGLDGWEINGKAEGVSLNEGVLRLELDDPTELISVVQRLPMPTASRYLRIEGRLATQDVRRGKFGFLRAQIRVVGIDAEGQGLWRYVRHAEFFRGTIPEQPFSFLFRLPAEAATVQVGMVIPRSTGVLEVADLSLHAVDETTLFVLCKYGLIGLWALAGVLAVRLVLRDVGHGAMRVGLAALAVGGLAALLMPVELRQALSLDLAPVRAYLGVHQDVAGHFGLFFILAFSLRIARPRDWWIAQVLGLLLLAAVSEVVQLFAVQRGPSFDDWLVDGLAVVLAATLAQTLIIATRVVMHKRRARSERLENQRG
ncbi:MAG: VanZ family protein [Geminicoccaceae bacterium]